jgi:hypothetical protein
VAPEVAAELAEALAQLGAEDVAPHCAGCTVEECMRCAAVIRAFIVDRLTPEGSLFIEDD